MPPPPHILLLLLPVALNGLRQTIKSPFWTTEYLTPTMVSTRSTPSKPPRPPAAANTASSSPGAELPTPTPSPSRAEQTTQTLNAQIASAIPSTLPTSPSDLPSLPTLDDAPPVQAAKSHLVLASLVFGGVFLGWFLGFDLLQVSGHNSWPELAALLGGFAVALVAALHWVGVSRIDFWEMMNGYWWLAVPIAVAAMATVTVMQERATGLHEVE